MVKSCWPLAQHPKAEELPLFNCGDERCRLWYRFCTSTFRVNFDPT